MRVELSRFMNGRIYTQFTRKNKMFFGVVTWQKINMFTVGGSYARLFAGKALVFDVVWKVEAFFLPCSIAMGSSSQHII